MAVSLEQPRRITALDAVNIMLREVGEDPVNSLGDTAKPTAQKAEGVLAEQSIFVQGQGYNFSTEDRLLLTPNTAGNLVLPSNILSFEPTDVNYQDRLIEDGGRLYDTYDSTYVFTANVYIKAVLARPFAQLPQPVRWYVAHLAAITFTNSENPDSQSIRITAENVREAKRLMEVYDRRLKKGGLRRSNPHIRRLRGNR